MLLAGACAVVAAAELGEAQVRSFSGQPLVADVELVALGEDNQAVQVRLANADVFRGANIRMQPALSSLFMSVMRRDGRQFLHLTTVKPVDGDFLHLFLELNEGGRRSVRQVTLWLAADPNPAPVAEPSRQAFEAAVAHAATDLPPVLARARGAARPAACAFSADQIKTCAAIDYKNGVLTAQIVELEEKVRLLQAAIEVKPAVTPPIKTVARIEPAPAPKPKPTPWLLIGASAAGVLALLGGGLVFYLKRKKAKGGKAGESAPATPGLFAKLKTKFKRMKTKADATPPEEPSLS